jgi:hypothetical protein
MPLIEIATSRGDIADRRRVARGLSLWFARRGVALGHVIVRFERLESESVFSGPYPLVTQSPDGDGADAALVTCAIAHDRPRAFRQALGQEIRALLAPVPPARILIAFRGVDRDSHVLASELEEALAEPAKVG